MENPYSLNLFVALCRTFDTVSHAAKCDIKKYGLSLSEFEVLELLYHKGEHTIQNIAKKVLLKSGSMTYVVNQLCVKQLVLRKICESDRRITYVAISESGTALMELIFPQHALRIAELFSSLSTEETIYLTENLKKISKSIMKEDKL